MKIMFIYIDITNHTFYYNVVTVRKIKLGGIIL